METALRRVRDPGLLSLKPIRKEPRFQVLMWELKFPE